MNSNQIFTATTQLNAQQAKNELRDLAKTYADLEAKKNKMIATDGKNAKGIKEVNNAMRETKAHMSALQTRLQQVDHVMANLSTAGIKDIQAAIKKINAELRSGAVERGSAEWRKLQGDLKACKAELNSINQESAQSESIWSKLGNGFNKYQSLVVSALASFTGLTLTVRQAVKAYSDMEEEEFQVVKYTGMTKKEVEELNEQFKKMDTRTSREQLNQLADDAGRLGISSKQGVMEFVDAADKINVALGDDLGDKATETIGKLAMMFGEDSKYGLNTAMLKTGSVINELAQTSSASGGYLAEFASRVAGVGKSAGLTQAQIMSFGSVLDQNMQQDEMAATAFSQLVSKMFLDPAKFARLAGENVKSFSALLKTDANAAIMQFLSAMKSKGGFDTIAPMFADMGLDGARATSVLSVLADKLGDIKKAQDVANTAYAQGTSLTKEFNVQNNTVQAGIDKATKRFHDLSVELGEKLMPIAKHAITTGSAGIKLLSDAINFGFKYKTTLMALTTALILLNAQKIIDVTCSKLQVLWNSKIITGLKALYVTMMANPYTTVIIAVTTIIALYKDLNDVQDDVTQTQKDLNDINDTAASQAEVEKYNLNSLLKVAKDEKKSKDERKNAIKQLNDISPEYLGFLSLETINTKKADLAIQQYTKSIILNAKAQALRAKIEDIEKKKIDAKHAYDNGDYSKWYDPFITGVNSVANTISKAGNAVSTLLQNGSTSGWYQKTNLENDGYILNSAQYGFNRYKADTIAFNAEQTQLNKEIQQTTADMMKELSISKQNSPSGNNTNYVSEKEQKAREAAERKKEAAARKAAALKEKLLNEAVKKAKAQTNLELSNNMLSYQKGEITYTEYIDKKHKIASDGYDALKKIYKKSDEEYKNYIKQQEDEDVKYEQTKTKIALSDIDHQKAVREAYIQSQFYNNQNPEAYQNEDVLNEAMFQSDIQYIHDKQNLYKKGSEDWENYEQEITEKELFHKLDKQEDYQKRLDELRKNYGQLSNEEQMKLELKGLDSLYAVLKVTGGMKEEEYQKFILAIKAKYAAQMSEENGPGSNTAKFKQRSNTMLDTAQSKAGDAASSTGDDSFINSIVGNDIANWKNTNEQLKELEKSSQYTHAEYLQARADNDAQYLQNMVTKFQAAFSSISDLMSAASSYYQACSDAEVQSTQSKYEKEITAAGSNTAKTKKLKAKEEKEVAAIKSKYAEKQATMQIAQAVASTAMAAINAYASALQIGPAGLVLAPIAAAMAIAAGAIQIATIQKQADIQKAGYYSGGLTGFGDYRQEAGVVHRGEFVLNHEAVNNPNLTPMIRVIDNAQRNNKVASLQPNDINPTVPTINTVVVAQQDTGTADAIASVNETTERNAKAIDRLNKHLDDGIESYVVIDGPNGLHQQYKHYKKLISNK